MLKYHKLISFCFGLLFLIVLQKFATPLPVFRFLAPAFILYAAVMAIYNKWYLRQIQKYNFWSVLRSVMLLISAFGIFLVLPTGSLRGIFLILTVRVITLAQIVLGLSAENILLNETLLIGFGLFFALCGAYYYFPSYQPLFAVGVFLAAALLARSFYEFTPQTQKTKLVGAIILGLFCLQLYWAINFLPFSFSALAILLFLAFYFCLILNYYHLFHNLNYKKIQFHLFLIAGCTAVVLAATPWFIIQ